jgi:competence protein ComEC
VRSAAVRAVAAAWPWGRAGRGSTAPLPATSGAAQGPSFVETLRGWAVAETGPGQLLPWIPVAFAAGIALYFAADREPLLLPAVGAAGGLAATAWLARRRALFVPLALAAALAAGFAGATFKAARVGHGVLARPIFAATVKGFVESREIRERTDRFVLRISEMDPAPREGSLTRVRLSVRKGTAPAVGSFVELKARLTPPLSPLRPGSYDFGRDLFFQGIGATGFVTGAIQLAAPPAGGGWWLGYAAALQGLRDAVDARIGAVLGGDARAIATALLTGRRDALSAPVNDALFVSGLGHVLSISGYHMAVVAGAVFFAVRALLALSPGLAAGRPIKKWAAAVALGAAAFYLALSGAEVATQRSFMMTALVLVAVMTDRRAITFRTLALAALAVLAVAPEALVHPSFQMSFAATLGLVALVSQGMPSLLATPDNSAVARAALWGGREVMMLLLASTIAGLATMPYAAYHFHRVTPYGVLSNLAAMPVVSAVVMPAGLLGLVAMPFGFDGVFWRIMDAGIAWMIAVSQWVAALPGAVGRVGAFGTGPLLAASLGLVLLGLLRSPLRLAGLALVAGAAVAAWTAPQPDLLVSADGRHMAVRGPQGRLQFAGAGKDAFLQREWLAADADARAPGETGLGGATSCDDEGCVAPLRGGGLVALSLQRESFADDCRRAAVVIARGDLPAGCAALAITESMLARHGALALYRDDRGFRIEGQRATGQQRPWNPLAGEGGEGGAPAAPASSAPRGAPAAVASGRSTERWTRPVDATPPDPQADD